MGQTPVMDGIGAMTDDERERYEERAAIAEFDNGWPRPIAEAEARRSIGQRRWLLEQHRAAESRSRRPRP